jgi:hypothetical protein
MQVRFKDEELQEPLTLDEAKDYTHITHKAEDSLISTYIKAARVYCEQITGFSLINRAVIIQSTIPMYNPAERGFEDLPHAIIDPNNTSHRYKLPYGPVIAITEVKLTKKNGDSVVIGPSFYTLDEDFDLLYWKLEDSLIAISEYEYVKIKYTVSWGNQQIPADIKEAMLELISNMFYHKGDIESIYPKIHTKLANYQIQKMYEAL